jgi:hypothetical protein
MSGYQVFASWSVPIFPIQSDSEFSQLMSTVPSQYFKVKRGLSNGLVYAGGGLGGACLSFGIDSLIQRLGVAWAFRIIGLLAWATGLPAAWLVKERVPIRASAFIEW